VIETIEVAVEAVTSNIVIAGLEHRIAEAKDFDLAKNYPQAFRDVGIFMEMIDVMAVAVPFCPPWPHEKFGRVPYTIFRTGYGPIPAIVGAVNALFYGANFAFGLVCLIDGHDSGKIFVGLMALNKTNYLPNKWVPESFLASIVKSADSDITDILLDKANQKLAERGKPPIYNAEIEILRQSAGDETALPQLFEMLEGTSPSSKHFVILVWEGEYGQDAILIQVPSR